MSRLPDYLTEEHLAMIVAAGLTEDVGTGDVTTAATIEPGTQASGRFICKADGRVAGLYVAARVFAALDPSVRCTWHVADGDAVETGQELGRITGDARAILEGERLALNLLQRMSGIATATARMVHAANGTRARILDTRKTAPGLRLLDKWAVLLGGGTNHRVGLYDMILVKDNHIAACGGVARAIGAARRYRQDARRPELRIEIEVRTDDELSAVLDVGGVDVVLLDNMVASRADGTIDTSRLADAVARVDGRFRTEASGNVTDDTVAAIAATGVDFISSGALTHSVRALDVSLQIRLGG